MVKIKNKENNTLLIVLVLLAIFLFFSFGGNMMLGTGYGMMGNSMFVFGHIFMILLLVLIVWLVISLIKDR
ncbi:hypothetical protein HYV88_01010 [Candidatus Woesearchaeota archaeon]|nr:hypothetical protein [Candidatus Woesearchaeota archaeon]